MGRQNMGRRIWGDAFQAPILTVCRNLRNKRKSRKEPHRSQTCRLAGNSYEGRRSGCCSSLRSSGFVGNPAQSAAECGDSAIYNHLSFVETAFNVASPKLNIYNPSPSPHSAKRFVWGSQPKRCSAARRVRCSAAILSPPRTAGRAPIIR